MAASRRLAPGRRHRVLLLEPAAAGADQRLEPAVPRVPDQAESGPVDGSDQADLVGPDVAGDDQGVLALAIVLGADAVAIGGVGPVEVVQPGAVPAEAAPAAAEFEAAARGGDF